MNSEFSFKMPSFSRGPEVEVGYRKEVEELMHVLSKHQINVPNKVLQNAIVMPKDRQEAADSYPSVASSLFHNPFGTPEYKKAQAIRLRNEAKLAKAQSQAAKKSQKKAGKKGLEKIEEAPQQAEAGENEAVM
jgi:hypothetical protein